MMINIYLFCLSALLTWLLIRLFLPQLRKLIIDTPNARSSHNLPTARGGGIAFVIVGSSLHFLSTTGSMRWVPLVCIPLAIVGMLDDYYGLPANLRYLVQFFTAIALLFTAKLELSIGWILVFLILITAIINFMNFMDGLDGLLAGCAVLLMGAISAWSIAGAIMGFLLWNWSPAKVFMGDVGSTFIGAIFAGLLLQQANIESAFTVLCLGLPLFGDAVVCLLRRLLSGQNIFRAHRQHLYQRLNQAGWSHRKVSLIYILSVALLLVAQALGGWQFLIISIFAEILIAFYMDSNVAVKFDYG